MDTPRTIEFDLQAMRASGLSEAEIQDQINIARAIADTNRTPEEIEEARTSETNIETEEPTDVVVISLPEPLVTPNDEVTP